MHHPRVLLIDGSEHAAPRAAATTMVPMEMVRSGFVVIKTRCAAPSRSGFEWTPGYHANDTQQVHPIANLLRCFGLTLAHDQCQLQAHRRNDSECDDDVQKRRDRVPGSVRLLLSDVYENSMDRLRAPESG